MKCLINVILFVLVCSCAVSSHRSAQPEAISQLSTGNVANLIHQLAKRQTSQSTQDLIDCAIIATDYQCGSSGYAQLIADIALSCRNESYALVVLLEHVQETKMEIFVEQSLFASFQLTKPRPRLA